MNRYEDPPMLTLLRDGHGVTIDGEVWVDASNPAEFGEWLEVLSAPVLFAWRSAITGERRVQVCSASTHGPVRGRVTVVLDGDRHRVLWDALLKDDLGCGDEQDIDPGRFQYIVRAAGARSIRTLPAA